MLQVLRRTALNPSTWNQASDNIDNAWAWHRWELLEARQTWNHTSDLSFAIIGSAENQEILALVPLFLVSTNRISIIFGSYLESTGGPAISSNLPRRTLEQVRGLISEEIRRLAKEHRVSRTDISCPPLAPALRSVTHPHPNPLCHFGASDASTQSWVLNISEQSEEELWMTLEHRCRKQIKKAQRNNLVARLVTPDEQMLEVYYALHRQTCDRNGIPPHPMAYFEKIFTIVAAAGLCKSCLIMQDDDILAIHNFLVYKNCALYWTTAGSSQALKLCANDLGIWHSVNEFRKSDIEQVECGEAFPAASSGKIKGLNDFKKSFGGELFPYYRGQIIHRPIAESLLNIAKHVVRGRVKS